ncbi:hypothetical protein CYLTODRAFT_347729 [Cylindrobasidium torrendii FP15055 ss-10]|uniref:Uncharacterized protein n=1 Tax=Cylindrobasidium torrendii FP15055 ss-10 TaxID=1314674 RepID=A0A0D7BIQ3_9AGAR|nr:hypothetical protein CYLTODRAFT_347729 [Cylindrobasidium torrendii FP15055 ss-10]
MSTITPANAINITIDDTYGDSETGAVPIYSPVNAWDGADCMKCAIQPDASKAHDGSWYAATYNKGMESLNISFSFEGTALYVYFILANDEGVGITTTTAVTFTLDGVPDGDFTHIPLDAEGLQYNELVYARTGLNQEWHDFLISTSGFPGDDFVNFDYALYT